MPPIRMLCCSGMDGTDCIAGGGFVFGDIWNILEIQEGFNAFDKSEVTYLKK